MSPDCSVTLLPGPHLHCRKHPDVFQCRRAVAHHGAALLDTAVIVLDRDLRVDVWNPRSTALWAIRADEARKAHFFNVEFGLPVAELHQPIRDVIVDGDASREITLSASNRKGRAAMPCQHLAAVRGGRLDERRNPADGRGAGGARGRLI
jgi:hypothetical protein